MSETMQGVVEEITNGKKIRVGGRNYSAFDGVQAGINELAVGDSVSFQYTEKPGTGKFAGITFKNIQGRVTKMTGAVATPAAAVPSNVNAVSLSRDRAIIRQNALTNSVNLLVGTSSELGFEIDEKVLDGIISTAMKFEEYTSGDLDKKVLEEMKEEFNPED